MARRSATISISLFPFLAVLLCAMGALIVLLVILTHQIRENVFAEAIERRVHTARVESEHVEQASPVVPPVPRPERVTIVRPAPPAAPEPVNPNIALREDLANIESRFQEVEPRVRALREAFEAARAFETKIEQERQAAQLRRDADSQRLRARQSELDEQRERLRAHEGRLAAARDALVATEAQAATTSAKVRIVPYDGRLGTARRPILIECTAEHIRFVPEDVSLMPSELEGFRVGFNPLLAGAAALRNYWKVQDGSDAAPPYVLLLVHEDGIIAYYAARSLLDSLNAEMGYELITSEQKLAYPPVDPVAREICQNAVQEILSLRSASGPALAGDGKNFPNGRFDVDPSEHDPTRREPSRNFRLPQRKHAGEGLGSGEGSGSESGSDSRGMASSGGRTDVPPELSPGFPQRPGGSAKDSIARGEAGMGKAGMGKAGMGEHAPEDFSGEMPEESDLPALPRGDIGGAPQVLTPSDARPLVSAPSRGSRGRSSGSGESSLSDRTPVGRDRPTPPRLTSRGAAEGEGNSPVESNFLDRLRHWRREGGKRPLEWGESSPHAIISLERSVRVTVSESFVQVGGQPARLVGAQGITDEVIQDVFLGIETEARSWGSAPESFYWTPHIKVFVQPGGEHSFTQLKSVFQKAGLPVSDQLELGHQQAAIRGVEHVTPAH